MFWYVNREDLQLPNALLVCSPTSLGRPLGAQFRYLIAGPRIAIDRNAEHYREMYLGIENYVAINLDARNYKEKYLDIKKYGEIDLDSEKYGAIDPDAYNYEEIELDA